MTLAARNSRPSRSKSLNTTSVQSKPAASRPAQAKPASPAVQKQPAVAQKQDGYSAVPPQQAKQKAASAEMPVSSSVKQEKAPRPQGTATSTARTAGSATLQSVPKSAPAPGLLANPVLMGPLAPDGSPTTQSVPKSAPARGQAASQAPVGHAPSNGTAGSASSNIQAGPSKQEQLAALRSKNGKAGNDVVQITPGQIETKPLIAQYQTAEKAQPTRKVLTEEGKEIEVRDKKIAGQTDQSTQYFTGTQKEASKVGFRPVAQDVNNTPNVALTQKVEGQSKPLDTEKKIFVMDKAGQIYAGKGGTTKIDGEKGRSAVVHHSSFLQGKAVAGAGELLPRADGTLGTITDGSGHHQPGLKQTLQTMNQLEKQGVNLQNTRFELQRGSRVTPEVTAGMAEELRQGGGSESLFKARHAVGNELKIVTPNVRKELDGGADAVEQKDVKRREDASEARAKANRGYAFSDGREEPTRSQPLAQSPAPAPQQASAPNAQQASAVSGYNYTDKDDQSNSSNSSAHSSNSSANSSASAPRQASAVSGYNYTDKND